MTEVQFEGLRERKKRLTRQLISDTATNLFLERGFDEVRISEIAAACEVSEKTIYNYFPTKESLVLDREESIAADIRWALGADTAGMSPVEAAVHTISEDMTRMLHYWDDGPDSSPDLGLFRRFRDMLENTPSLRAAQREMMDRLVEVAAHTMAERAGIDPEEPEPLITANAIMGLWRVQFTAMHKYADGTKSRDRDEGSRSRGGQKSRAADRHRAVVLRSRSAGAQWPGKPESRRTVCERSEEAGHLGDEAGEGSLAADGHRGPSSRTACRVASGTA